MRKKITLILICVACMAFGGCFIEQAPLNDKEIGIVSQYAADILLKYNKNYSDMLLTLEQLTPTPTRVIPVETPAPTATSKPTAIPSSGPDNTPKPTGSQAPSETPAPTATPAPTEIPDNTEDTFKQIAKVIGAEEFTVSLKEFIKPVAEYNYSVNGIPQKFSGKDGKLYAVIEFVITNSSDSSKNLNCFTKELSGALSINAKPGIYPCDTLPINDLRYIGVGESPEVVEAGESYEAVLIFAVDKDTEISKAALTLTNKEKESVVIKIK